MDDLNLENKNNLAPDSMSLERHRLMWLFLNQKTNLFKSKLRFLHIAPEYCFIKIFKKHEKFRLYNSRFSFTMG